MATPDQIAKVKTNIRNMIDFNNELYTQGNTKILNAYALLSIPDNKDLGLQIGLNLLCGAFWALGTPFGGVGAVAANFLAGVVGGYAVTTPPSLQAAFSSLILRFQQTSEQTTSDLEIVYADPNTYWNTVYSGQVITPFDTYTASATVSDLDTIDFPAITDPQFMDMIYTAQYALDQVIWANLLKNFILTEYIPSRQYPATDPPYQSSLQVVDTEKDVMPTVAYYSETGMENLAAQQIAQDPSYWWVWTYVHETKKNGKDMSYWDTYIWTLGSGATAFSDGHLNTPACNYLFIDSIDNVIINANGLYHRNFVFNNLGIQTQTHYSPNSTQ
jgi:hypothetical protein